MILRTRTLWKLWRRTQASCKLRLPFDSKRDNSFLHRRGSQEERISILRMALAQKGIPAEAHCANGSQPAPAPPQEPTAQDERAQTVPVISNGHAHTSTSSPGVAEIHVDEDGGVDL